MNTAQHVVHWSRQMVTPAQTDADIMRMAREASTATTGRFVFQLKAKGEEKGEDAFEKRFCHHPGADHRSLRCESRQ